MELIAFIEEYDGFARDALGATMHVNANPVKIGETTWPTGSLFCRGPAWVKGEVINIRITAEVGLNELVTYSTKLGRQVFQKYAETDELASLLDRAIFIDDESKCLGGAQQVVV